MLPLRQVSGLYSMALEEQQNHVIHSYQSFEHILTRWDAKDTMTKRIFGLPGSNMMSRLSEVELVPALHGSTCTLENQFSVF